MARILEVASFDEALRKRLTRSFQSGNITFLLGSGASFPAIPVAGDIEAEIAKLLTDKQDDDAYSKMYEFLLTIQSPTNKLIEGTADTALDQTIGNYEEFLRVIEEILTSRRTTLLPRQVTIFSTNYDLFVERASTACPTALLNDGFGRTPGLGVGMEYSSRNFFRTTYNTGNLYEYKVEIPSINLIKLHGSLSWAKAVHGITLVSGAAPVPGDPTLAEKRSFVDKLAVVLPQASKFRETLMDRTYYDLLRIYANALDRENTLLVTFGFSFGDEHIRDITIRALKNPTLRLMIFAFNGTARDRFSDLFAQYSNVEIISATEGDITFDRFNASLKNVLHAPQDDE